MSLGIELKDGLLDGTLLGAIDKLGPSEGISLGKELKDGTSEGILLG